MVHVAVVGAYGSAGVAVARRLLEVPDVELTLIDGGQPGGGLCILRGCMPSKDVLSAAAHRYWGRADPRVEGSTAVDLDAAVEHEARHVAEFAAHRRESVHAMAERSDVAFLHGEARFVDDRDLRVDLLPEPDLPPAVGEPGGSVAVEPDYVVIATGSTPNVPDLPGLDAVDYWTSADVLDATTLPDSGVVMGFGYVGLELAPYLAEAGCSDLTVIEHDARPLDEADPAYGDEVLSLYREAFGIDVRTHTWEQRVEPTADGGVRLHVERRPPASDGGTDADGGSDEERDASTPAARGGDEADARDGGTESGDADAGDGSAESGADPGEAPSASDGDEDAGPTPASGARDATARAERDAIEADALFLFTGRRPNLDGLGLEHTAIEPGPGWVADTMQAVDDERVFVVGDANGIEPILHVAKEQGVHAADAIVAHAAGEPLEPYEPLHHHVVFTALGVYPFVRIGHSEASAAAADLDFVVVHREARDDGVFRVKNAAEGRATLVVGTDGTVLGYQGLHYHADVMAKTLQIAIELGLDVRDLPDRAFHPTTPEILDGLFRDAVAELESL